MKAKRPRRKPAHQATLNLVRAVHKLSEQVTLLRLDIQGMRYVDLPKFSIPPVNPVKTWKAPDLTPVAHTPPTFSSGQTWAELKARVSPDTGGIHQADLDRYMREVNGA